MNKLDHSRGFDYGPQTVSGWAGLGIGISFASFEGFGRLLREELIARTIRSS